MRPRLSGQCAFDATDVRPSGRGESIAIGETLLLIPMTAECAEQLARTAAEVAATMRERYRLPANDQGGNLVEDSIEEARRRTPSSAGARPDQAPQNAAPISPTTTPGASS